MCLHGVVHTGIVEQGGIGALRYYQIFLDDLAILEPFPDRLQIRILFVIAPVACKEASVQFFRLQILHIRIRRLQLCHDRLFLFLFSLDVPQLRLLFIKGQEPFSQVNISLSTFNPRNNVSLDRLQRAGHIDKLLKIGAGLPVGSDLKMCLMMLLCIAKTYLQRSAFSLPSVQHPRTLSQWSSTVSQYG